MAHWAKIDEDNVVVSVVVADDDKGEWLTEQIGGRWIQTSYNTQNGIHLLGGTPLRGNYAGVGFKYHEDIDAFMPAKPALDLENGIADWAIDTETYTWIPIIEQS